MLNNRFWSFWQMTSETVLFPLCEPWLRSDKASQVGSSSEPPDRSRSDILWAWAFERALILFFPLHWLPGYWFSLWLWAVGFQSYYKTEERDRISSNPTKIAVLRFIRFSWINAPEVAASLWIISRVLHRLILTIFAKCMMKSWKGNAVSKNVLRQKVSWSSPGRLEPVL